MHEFLLTPPPQAKAAPFTVYVKLRPGVQAFLQQARSLFDLHIYTMGTKEYADGIAKILDPEVCLVEVMKRVLSSVRLAFVGFTTDPEEFQGSDLWNKAVQFGAEAFVPRELDAEGHPFSAPPGDRLTHIIVSRGTTYSKVRDQLGLSSLEGIHVVHWRWLVDCTKNWQPQKEDPYYIDESFRK
eukprot:tig00000478_g1287.t1